MTFLKTRPRVNGRFLSGAVLTLFFIQLAQVNAQVLPLTQIDNNRFATVESQGNNRMEASSEHSSNDGQAIVSATQRSTASEIWTALLLGNSRQKISKPRFAFSPRRSTYDYHGTFPSFERGRQNLVNDQSFSQKQNPPHSNASSISTRNDAALTMADSRTNESFSRLDEASISENKQIEERENLDTRDVKRRIEELDRYLAVNRPPKEDVQHAQQSVEETVLSREFPKTYPIRQVNGETPRVQKNKVKSSMFDEKLPSPNNGTVANTASSRSGQKAFPVADLASEKTIPETLPVKPNALQVTERSFLSTEIVRLPTAGNLARPKAKPTAQDTAKMNSNNSSSERIPTFVHPEDAAKNNSFPIDSKETTQQLSIERNSSVLRPRGKFVNPRNL